MNEDCARSRPRTMVAAALAKNRRPPPLAPGVPSTLIRRTISKRAANHRLNISDEDEARDLAQRSTGYPFIVLKARKTRRFPWALDMVRKRSEEPEPKIPVVTDTGYEDVAGPPIVPILEDRAGYPCGRTVTGSYREGNKLVTWETCGVLRKIRKSLGDDGRKVGDLTRATR